MAEDPANYWSTLFEADDLSSRVTLLRNLVRAAAVKDLVALQLLVEMLPSVDRLLADVQAAGLAAHGQRHPCEHWFRPSAGDDRGPSIAKMSEQAAEASPAR
jgi:hypothetical protein